MSGFSTKSSAHAGHSKPIDVSSHSHQDEDTTLNSSVGNGLALPQQEFPVITRAQKAAISWHNTKVRTWHNLTWLFLIIGAGLGIAAAAFVLPAPVVLIITAGICIVLAVVISVARNWDPDA